MSGRRTNSAAPAQVSLTGFPGDFEMTIENPDQLRRWAARFDEAVLIFVAETAPARVN
jgi:hypothetical protein